MIFFFAVYLTVSSLENCEIPYYNTRLAQYTGNRCLSTFCRAYGSLNTVRTRALWHYFVQWHLCRLAMPFVCVCFGFFFSFWFMRLGRLFAERQIKERQSMEKRERALLCMRKILFECNKSKRQHQPMNHLFIEIAMTKLIMNLIL